MKAKSLFTKHDMKAPTTVISEAVVRVYVASVPDKPPYSDGEKLLKPSQPYQDR
jgi:hypothetical protein